MRLLAKTALAALTVYSLPGAGLYEQALERALRHEFPQAEYLVLDIATGSLISSSWNDPDRPVSLGSLVKPLLLHSARYPLQKFTCDGAKCWLRRGHGQLGPIEALAQSCNSYFLQLAPEVTVAAAEMGLPPPPVAASPGTLIGLGRSWPIAPLALLRAYPRLAEHHEIAAGLRLAASHGTASAIGMNVMAKTGTAPCAHGKSRGDGYIIALYPAVRPRIAILVREHGITGARSAILAGKLLRAIHRGS